MIFLYGAGTAIITSWITTINLSEEISFNLLITSDIEGQWSGLWGLGGEHKKSLASSISITQSRFHLFIILISSRRGHSFSSPEVSSHDQWASNQKITVSSIFFRIEDKHVELSPLMQLTLVLMNFFSAAWEKRVSFSIVYTTLNKLDAHSDVVP